MKKKVLALSVALAVGGVAGVASAAVSVADGGVGHNLILPYFSVQQGQATLLSIVNTDSINAKAVKVRFRGAVDSDDVFDFQVFLSPNDIWTANVSADAAGNTKLTTVDTSCTIPQGVGKTITNFVTTRLAKTDAVGAKEGYVEIFNMADVPPYLGQFAANNAWSRPTDLIAGAVKNPLFTAIKHVMVGGVMTPPCQTAEASQLLLEAIESGLDTNADGLIDIPATYSASALGVDKATAYAATTTALTTTLSGVVSLGKTDVADGAWKNGVAVPGVMSLGGTIPSVGTEYFVETASGQQAPYLAAPTGTLFGNWMLVNTTDAGAYGGAMTSLKADGKTRIVYSSQYETAVNKAQNMATDFPNISATADAVLLQQFVKTAKYDFPDVSTPYSLTDNLASKRAAELSSAMLATQVQNEFFSDTSVNGATDFVLSQPTRRYHVAGRVGLEGVYDGSKATKAWAQLNSTTATTPAITDAYYPSLPYSRVTTLDKTTGHASCVKTGSSLMHDREEYAKSGGNKPVVSPSVVVNAADVFLCNEAGVVSVNAPAVAAGKFTGAVLSQYTGVVIGGMAFMGAQNLTLDDAYLKASGWVDWTLASKGSNSYGLPLLGQVFIKVGVGGSGFGVNTPHRFTPYSTTGAVLPVPTIGTGTALLPLFDLAASKGITGVTTGDTYAGGVQMGGTSAAPTGSFYVTVMKDAETQTAQP